jgi:hypothetical protein
MGYRETETKHALARVPESSTVSLEQLIRQALRELGAASVSRARSSTGEARRGAKPRREDLSVVEEQID